MVMTTSRPSRTKSSILSGEPSTSVHVGAIKRADRKRDLHRTGLPNAGRLGVSDLTGAAGDDENGAVTRRDGRVGSWA